VNVIPGFVSGFLHVEWDAVAALIVAALTGLACREIWRM
jgi:hypothetical protein